MSSQPQRQGRHQRRASQSVFVLPENLATLEFDAAADVIVGGTKLQADLIKKDGGGGVAEKQQQAKQPAGPGRHRRAMSVSSVAPIRDVDELVTEDIGSFKLGA